MTREEALQVKLGDRLRPDPLWNETTPREWLQLPSPCVVVAVRRGASQTGVLFEVITCGGSRIELDAGWFERKEDSE